MQQACKNEMHAQPISCNMDRNFPSVKFTPCSTAQALRHVFVPNESVKNCVKITGDFNDDAIFLSVFFDRNKRLLVLYCKQ